FGLATSELQPCGERDLSRRLGAGELPGGGVQVDVCSIPLVSGADFVELGVVQDVEGLETQAQSQTFPNRNLLIQRRIDVEPGRLTEGTSSDIPKRTDRSETKSRRIEVVVEVLAEVLRVRHHLAPNSRNTVGADAGEGRIRVGERRGGTAGRGSGGAGS